VVTVKVPNSEELALSVIRELWEIGRGYNVVVVVQQDELLNLYTWFPYSSHDNCANVKNVVLVNQWVMEGEGKFVRDISPYPCKIPTNFQSCVVNLSTTMKGGIEDEIYSHYFLTHNITKNYVNVIFNRPEDLEEVITFMKNFWDLYIDMTFGSIPLVVEEISNGEPTFPYFSMKVSWFVPCPKPFSRLQRISHIFSPSMWVGIVVVLFLVTGTSWCLAKNSNDSRSYTTMSSALYNIWAVIVGVSVTRKPRSLRLKLLFIVFVWYCSAINTVFLTFLTSFLVDPGYGSQLTSLDEILDSGIEFGYVDAFRILFVLYSDSRYKEIGERAEICSTSEVCVNRIRETGNFATFSPVFIVQNYTNTINDHSTVCLLNDDDYDFFYITTYVQKGSFLLESLNKYITLGFESGVFDRFLKDITFMSRYNRNNIDVPDGYFVFNLSHLLFAFYVLFFGHGLSFLLFLCEVFYHFKFR